ncbi:MAG TPA: hypothetical protein VGA37_10215 [Gemmatimonadales bacterium]
MSRLSNRISNALATVKCPACGKHVVPTILAPDAEPSGESGPGKRWSFIWVPPQGEVCPECSFPLARYARRATWLRVFMLGVVLSAVWLVLRVLSGVSDYPAWLRWAQRLTAWAAPVVLIVGLLGLVIGGRRDPTDT